MRRSAGEPPHAVVPSLAVGGGGVIDAVSIRFLLSQTLVKRKEEQEKAKEEEKKAKKVKEEKMRALDARVAAGLPLTDAQWAAWHRRHVIPPRPSSSSSGGKREKRKKTKKKIITNNQQQQPPQPPFPAMADPLDVGAGAQWPTRSSPFRVTWLVM